MRDRVKFLLSRQGVSCDDTGVYIQQGLMIDTVEDPNKGKISESTNVYFRHW